MSYRLKYCTVHDSLWAHTSTSKEPEGECESKAHYRDEHMGVVDREGKCHFVWLEAHREGSKRL